MKDPTLAEFKRWIHARQAEAADAIPEAPSAELPDLYKRFARAATVIREMELFTDEIEKDAP